PSATHSTAPAIASNLVNGILDSRFFSTKKVSILIDDSNYILWWQQVLLAVKAYKLQSFLDLNTRPPPSIITYADGLLQENVEFTKVEQQDSALAFWLLSSVSPDVLPHLIGLDTSDMSMKEFLLKIKSYCDNLASCGEAISAHEHITAILNGLSFEYESIVSIILAGQQSYTVQNITTMLLDAEARQ
ncbi:hypothetical protein Gohar_022110, partial [Gossypium harknessii]|nr:hypothetical protein [Gossypium harknessii]